MKDRLKLLISLAVRAWDILHDWLRRLVGLPVPARCMVLYYHSVPAIHRELFARQLDRVLEMARPVATTETSGLAPGSRYVCITFDDGFVSVAQNAAPELSRRGVPWTIFVPSGCLGSRPAWLRTPRSHAREDRVMTAEEIRALALDPLVTIASHSVAHTNLLEVDPTDALRELRSSKDELERVIGRPVDQFSYPFGARNRATDLQALSAGYQRVFSSEPVPTFRLADKTVIGRVGVDADTSPLEFELKVLGAYRWRAAVARVSAFFGRGAKGRITQSATPHNTALKTG